MHSSTDYNKIAGDYAPIADEMAGNRYWERPATISLLPDLAGLDVLDAGCGAGFYSEYAADRKARVVGFDPAVQMVDYAKRRLGERAELHHCTTAELEQTLQGRQFDFIISGLVLHYVEDLHGEMKLLARRLKPGGKIVISMRHPFLSGGLVKSPVYWQTRSYPVSWPFGEMLFWHRSMSDMVDAFLGAGLVLETLLEPRPSPELEHADPKLWIWGQKAPLFVLFRLARPPL